MSSKRLMTVLCINTMKSCRVTSQCYKFEHDQVFLRPLVTQFYAFSEKKSPKPILNYNSWFWFLFDHASNQTESIKKWCNAFLSVLVSTYNGLNSFDMDIIEMKGQDKYDDWFFIVKYDDYKFSKMHLEINKFGFIMVNFCTSLWSNIFF